MSEKPNEMSDKYSTIRLPDDIIEKLEQRADATDFDSLEAYTEYILRAVLAELDPIDHTETVEANQEAVQNRLKSLGYLDE
ncbi:hypothetical protein [Haladaptatus halobius]|uniref:hypothetical protein n=1 Tax=Haladaptatus halobius TaxID=2884875 RepID=UPI001D09FA4C|nr:hypothetical protein [Haladaptatus halobius]